MDNNAGPMQQQARAPRKPQPTVSCLTCKRMKLKCDRRLPCERCVHNGRANACSYAPGQEPSAKTGGNASANKRQRTETGSSISDSEVTSTSFNDLQARVRQLERALLAQHATPAPAAQVQAAEPQTRESLSALSSPHPRWEGSFDGASASPTPHYPVAVQVRFMHMPKEHILKLPVRSYTVIRR